MPRVAVHDMPKKIKTEHGRMSASCRDRSCRTKRQQAKQRTDPLNATRCTVFLGACHVPCDENEINTAVGERSPKSLQGDRNIPHVSHLSCEGAGVDGVVEAPHRIRLRLQQLGEVCRHPLKPEKHSDLLLQRADPQRTDMTLSSVVRS